MYILALEMKSVVVLFLAVALHLSTFLNVGVGLYFHLNKQFIVQQLCENRDKPEMHCNGKCYLTKQLHKAEKAQSNAGSQIIKVQEEVIAEELKLAHLEIGILSNEIVTYNNNTFDLLSGIYTTQLRPPIS
jgi:hypothetical protein